MSYYDLTLTHDRRPTDTEYNQRLMKVKMSTKSTSEWTHSGVVYEGFAHFYPETRGVCLMSIEVQPYSTQ